MQDFARDLGYLDKFLVGLTKHADTLPPERGARLKALMAEESARWAEIKALLAGAAPTGAPAPAAPAAAPAAVQADAPATEPARPAASLTVGSLIGAANERGGAGQPRK